MINVIITSFREPKATLRAAQVFLKEKRKDLKVIVVDPFPETQELLKQNIKDASFEFILDPGRGKPAALNMIFDILFSEHFYLHDY